MATGDQEVRGLLKLLDVGVLRQRQDVSGVANAKVWIQALCVKKGLQALGMGIARLEQTVAADAALMLLLIFLLGLVSRLAVDAALLMEA